MGLGDNKAKFLFTCQGWTAPEFVHSLLQRLVELIGMTPARKHQIDHYPFNGGGGEGFTAYFPLMESYAVMDVYYDLNQTELLISTCMPDRLLVDVVKSFLTEQIGQTTGGKLKEE